MREVVTVKVGTDRVLFRRLEVPALVGPITQEQDTAAIKGVSSMYRYGMEVARVVRHIRVLDTAGYVDLMTISNTQSIPDSGIPRTLHPYRPLSHHAEGSIALRSGRVRERCWGVPSRGSKSAGYGVWNHPHPIPSSHPEDSLPDCSYEKPDRHHLPYDCRASLRNWKMKKLKPVLIVFVFGFTMISVKNSIAHEDIKRVSIDCSTEIMNQTKMDMTLKKMVSVPSRRTHFSIPINFVKKHIQIPEDPSFGFFQLSVVAVGKGSYKFTDTVSIPISNKGGKLRVIDPFGVPWKEVPSTDKGKQITDVECFLVM